MMKNLMIVAGLALIGLAAPALALQGGQGAVRQPATTTGASDPARDKSSSKSPAVAPSIPDLNQYRLVPGDKLRIEVYKDQQLSQSVQIRPDGKITLPLIGDLDAAGQPPMALRDSITQALREYVTNPTVTVIVVETAASLAYVVGEVGHPGSIVLQGGPVTVLQAIALAGGLRDFANTKNIRILRKSATGVQTIPFNYKESIRGAAPVYLQPGDTVVVPD
jgi:polysaccharide export outer membrane protein